MNMYMEMNIFKLDVIKKYIGYSFWADVNYSQIYIRRPVLGQLKNGCHGQVVVL